MERFYYDALNEFTSSEFYSKQGELEDVHFPVLFGDDGAFTDAHFNFRYMDKMTEAFHKHSKQVFGKQIDLRYSTMDEFLTTLQE